MKTVFGVDKVYGTLSPCRAKPQNRGKGKCPHGEHQELDTEEYDEETIKRFNEEKLTEYFNPLKGESVQKPFPDNVTENAISTHKGGGILSREEFQKGVGDVAQAFPEKDWDTIQDFYKAYSTRTTDGRIQKLFTDTEDNIHSYLTSEDPTAKKVREFLGPDIDLKNFSELLVRNVGAMTQSIAWANHRPPPLNRIVLSTVVNDMTKERYVASVLFFGGGAAIATPP